MTEAGASVVPAVVAWLAATAALSACLVALALAYARRRGLLDEPGPRRSHRAATPRGGGIGIVGALLVAFPVLTAWHAPRIEPLWSGAVLSGLAVVAAIGWFDDHRALRIWPRLATHGVAALAICGVLYGVMEPVAPYGTLPRVWAAATAFAVIASINLHNFMDGIDGLLAWQALFVFGLFAACGALSGAHGWALACATAAASVAGFLPFNFPRARIFLGDVGSGALGFVVAAFAATGVTAGFLDLGTALLAVSAFAIDAGLTLASRIARGRRWYSAHREHLYQWLVRGGRSHARVTGLYMAWNLCVVVPAALAVVQLPPLAGAALCVAVYALGALAWCAARRACLAGARPRGNARGLA